MGMFDQVEVPDDVVCPNCGAELTDWQSKDGPCELKLLQFWEVDNFYTSCDTCNTWVEYKRKDKRRPLPFSAYHRVSEEMDDE